MKKIFTSLFVILSLLTLYAPHTYAITRVARVDGWELYYTTSDESATITGTGNEGINSSTIVVPKEIDGYKVTYIEKNALRRTKLANIVLPDGIEHLDVQMPEELSSVTFPSNLKTIGESVFKYTRLKQVRLPKTVTSVGRSAFEGCESLTKAVLPEGLQFLGPDAFRGCTNLEEINIPDAIKWSVDDSFDGCRKIRKINYNGEMTANMKEAFKNTRYMRDLGTRPDIEGEDEEKERSLYSDTGTEHIITVENEDGVLSIRVNGYGVAFTDASPFVDANGRTQVPLRRIASRTGCRVEYDSETRLITLKRHELEIKLTIGSSDMEYGGRTISMDTEAVILNDRTFVPLRYLAQALGYEVEYNKK